MRISAGLLIPDSAIDLRGPEHEDCLCLPVAGVGSDPVDPAAALTSGITARVPMVVGSTLDEAGLLARFAPDLGASAARKLIEAYRRARAASRGIGRSDPRCVGRFCKNWQSRAFEPSGVARLRHQPTRDHGF